MALHCINTDYNSLTDSSTKTYLLIFRNSGFSTLGEIDSVLFVGPIAPATYFWLPLILVASSAALFAIVADS